MVVVVVVAVENVGKSLGTSPHFPRPASPGTTKKSLLTRGSFCVTLGLNREQRFNLLWQINCSIDWRKSQPFSVIFERRTTETARQIQHKQTRNEQKPRRARTGAQTAQNTHFVPHSERAARGAARTSRSAQRAARGGRAQGIAAL